MKYFLGRVSSKEQNLARQLKVAREKFDIPDENVYCDKITGSSFDRPQYNALKAIVQEGDEVIVKEFDRFGRNKDEMKRELEWFKQKGVIVRILDIPTTLIDFKDQTWVLLPSRSARRPSSGRLRASPLCRLSMASGCR